MLTTGTCTLLLVFDLSVFRTTEPHCSWLNAIFDGYYRISLSMFPTTAPHGRRLAV